MAAHGVCMCMAGAWASTVRRARRGAQGGPQPAVCVVQARVGWPERVAERGAQRGLRLCETRHVAQEGALLGAGAGGWGLGLGARRAGDSG